MLNIRHKVLIAIPVITVLLIAGLLFTQQVFAQGSTNTGGAGSGDQAQDRDRVQDPSTNEEDEPIQDRDQDRLQDPDQDQDRDRLYDSSLRINDEPIQDQDQLRDRLRDQLEDPDQDRDRIRANDSGGLQEVISVSEEVSDETTNDLGVDVRELMHNRNRVEIGVIALMAAQDMFGPYGGQISGIAQEIHSAYQMMVEEEEQIRSQSSLNRFFFGGDDESAEAIQAKLQQNELRVQQIRQYLDSCDCDQQVLSLSQEQVRNIEEEHTRLQQLVDGEVSRWGLFSWRF